MKFQEILASGMSGSVGGLTASRNRYGPYFRAKVLPVNPNTPNQAVVRGHFRDLSARWREVLTTPQRTAWETYAANVPLANGVVTGLNMYLRSNVQALRAGMSIVDTAPNVFDLGGFTVPVAQILSEAAQTIDIGFTDTDAWANETGSAMMIFSSPAQNVSRNFWGGPFAYANKIDGDSTTPPTSPATISIASYPFVAGQRVFFRATVLRADGRYSTPFQTSRIAGA